MTAALTDALSVLQAAVTDFLKVAEADLVALTNEEFLDVVQDVEAIRRQLMTADYPIVAELEVREFAELRLRRDTAGCLQELWRIGRVEASARVREAHELTARHGLDGQPLPARRPVLAEARGLGIVSSEQVKIVLETLATLPPAVPADDVEAAERILVNAAHSLGPRDLRNVAQRLRDTIDPDGAVPDEEEQQRRREFHLTPQPDGMVRAAGLLDAITGAKALAYFKARSAPRPEDVTGPDDRSPGQRQHDAWGDLLDLALRAQQHATDTSSPATMHVLIEADQLAERSGIAQTSFGQRLTVAQALDLAGHATLSWLVTNSSGGIMSYGRSRRLASKAQAEALIARDQGCGFPGCFIPPEWCERHHILAWIDGGPTDIDNLVLLCKYHHRRMLQQGWEIHMRNRTPWFTPPAHIDRERKPIRNIR